MSEVARDKDAEIAALASWLAVCVYRLGGKVVVKEEDQDNTEGGVVQSYEDEEGNRILQYWPKHMVGQA